jgi:hypothetical protein
MCLINNYLRWFDPFRLCLDLLRLWLSLPSLWLATGCRGRFVLAEQCSALRGGRLAFVGVCRAGGAQTEPRRFREGLEGRLCSNHVFDSGIRLLTSAATEGGLASTLAPTRRGLPLSNWIPAVPSRLQAGAPTAREYARPTNPPRHLGGYRRYGLVQ